VCEDEPRKRRTALAVLGVMLLLFAVLSVFSFTGERKQARPEAVAFGPYSALDGRRVFQGYNCMGCHTIVGNGAYFGPDLTDVYRRVGPAWLSAFLPSAGAWPTAAAVRVQLQDAAVAAAAGTDAIDAYLERYPAARERIELRGGHASFMPNLPFTRDEVGQLIAFLRYASELNTEGWPPVPWPEARATRAQAPAGGVAAAVSTAVAPAASAASVAAAPAVDAATQGARLVQDLGCLACHAVDRERKVGPGWGGLYGREVKLADGSTVKADDGYLEQKIVQPQAHTVAGFAPGVMPSFAGLTTPEQRQAIVAYIRSLGGR